MSNLEETYEGELTGNLLMEFINSGVIRSYVSKDNSHRAAPFKVKSTDGLFISDTDIVLMVRDDIAYYVREFANVSKGLQLEHLYPTTLSYLSPGGEFPERISPLTGVIPTTVQIRLNLGQIKINLKNLSRNL